MDSLDKLYLKLNRELGSIKEDASEEEVKKHFEKLNNLIEENDLIGELLLLDRRARLLHPVVVKLAKNKALYYEFIEPLTNISYKKYMDFILTISDKNKYDYLIKNIKYTAYNNMIESLFMNSIIMAKTDGKVYSSIFACLFSGKENDEFKIFCDSLLKKKASEFGLTIKSNPVTLSEHLKKMKATKSPKLALKRTNEYLTCGGNCNSENLINLNLTTFKLLKLFNMGQDVDYEVFKTIYHEIAHAKINEKSKIQSPFYDRKIYEQQKGQLFLSKDNHYYMANHKYFENEISAEIDGYENFLSDLEEYSNINFSKYRNLIRSSILSNSLYRVTEKYDEVGSRFDYLLKKNPDFLKRNKWLKYEYNKDGSRREISDLISEKANYQTDLEKEIRTEGNLESNGNATLTYLKNHKRFGEVDNLFYEMIYKKILEYSCEELDLLLSGYDSDILEEISKTITYIEDKISSSYNIIDENSLTLEDFTENRKHLDNKLNRLIEYRSILRKHIKIKKR